MVVFLPNRMSSRAELYEERLTVRGAEPTFNEDGVDLTQIRRALAMTPLERLAEADQLAAEVELLRRMAHRVSPSGKP